MVVQWEKAWYSLIQKQNREPLGRFVLKYGPLMGKLKFWKIIQPQLFTQLTFASQQRSFLIKAIFQVLKQQKVSIMALEVLEMSKTWTFQLTTITDLILQAKKKSCACKTLYLLPIVHLQTQIHQRVFQLSLLIPLIIKDKEKLREWILRQTWVWEL